VPVPGDLLRGFLSAAFSRRRRSPPRLQPSAPSARGPPFHRECWWLLGLDLCWANARSPSHCVGPISNDLLSRALTQLPGLPGPGRTIAAVNVLSAHRICLAHRTAGPLGFRSSPRLLKLVPHVGGNRSRLWLLLAPSCNLRPAHVANPTRPACVKSHCPLEASLCRPSSALNALNDPGQAACAPTRSAPSLVPRSPAPSCAARQSTSPFRPCPFSVIAGEPGVSIPPYRIPLPRFAWAGTMARRLAPPFGARSRASSPLKLDVYSRAEVVPSA